MSRRLVTILAALLVVVLGAGCEPSTAWAAKVGDTAISQDELTTWLEALAGSSSLRTNIFGSDVTVQGASPASYDMAFANGVLGILVQRTLIDEEVARRKIEVDPSLEQQVEDQVVTTVKTELKAADVEVPDGFYADLVDLFTHQSALIDSLGDDVQTWANEQFSRTDIQVNPKYGSWSAGGSVQPPAGPLAAPAG